VRTLISIIATRFIETSMDLETVEEITDTGDGQTRSNNNGRGRKFRFLEIPGPHSAENRHGAPQNSGAGKHQISGFPRSHFGSSLARVYVGCKGFYRRV